MSRSQRNLILTSAWPGVHRYLAAARYRLVPVAHPLRRYYSRNRQRKFTVHPSQRFILNKIRLSPLADTFRTRLPVGTGKYAVGPMGFASRLTVAPIIVGVIKRIVLLFFLFASLFASTTTFSPILREYSLRINSDFSMHRCNVTCKRYFAQ